MKYTQFRENINKIHTITCDDERMKKMLQCSKCSSKNELLENLAGQCFKISNVSSQDHAKRLIRDLESNSLHEYELELFYSLNDVSCVEEAIFELDKFIRRRKLVSEYRKKLRDAQNAVTIKRDGDVVDFMSFLEDSSAVKKECKRIKAEFYDKLAELDSETYQP